MRTREEIWAAVTGVVGRNVMHELMLEGLLDIRDLIALPGVFHLRSPVEMPLAGGLADFRHCPACERLSPGDALCVGCLHNRSSIDRLRAALAAKLDGPGPIEVEAPEPADQSALSPRDAIQKIADYLGSPRASPAEILEMVRELGADLQSLNPARERT